jgi:hypothetical protein
MTTVAMKRYNTQASSTVLSDTLLSTLDSSLEILRISSNMREKILEIRRLEHHAVKFAIKAHSRWLLETANAKDHEDQMIPKERLYPRNMNALTNRFLIFSTQIYLRKN